MNHSIAEHGNFPLTFNNWLHFRAAEKFTFDRHRGCFTWDSQSMRLYFYTEGNRAEMKEQFDILGWKCSEGLTYIQEVVK